MARPKYVYICTMLFNGRFYQLSHHNPCYSEIQATNSHCIILCMHEHTHTHGPKGLNWLANAEQPEKKTPFSNEMRLWRICEILI